MGDGDRNLKLNIELSSTGQEKADQAGASLTRIKINTEDLNDETKRSLGLLPPLAEENKKVADSFKLFHEEGAEARRLIAELTRISPMLGEAFRVLRSPIGGTIGAAIGLFVELKAHINEVNKALDEMGQHNAESNFLENLQERLGVLSSAAAAAQGYADKLKQIATGEQSISDKLKEQLALDKAIELARAGLESAQKALELAKVQQDEAGGKLSPEKAAEKRAEIEKRYIAQAQADHEAAQNQELAEKQRQLAEDQANKDALAKKQRETENVVDSDEAHRASVKASLPDLNKQAADIQGQIDEANRNIDTIKRGGGASVDSPFHTEYIKAIAEQQAAIEKLQAALAQVNQQRGQFNATQSDPSAAKLQAEKDAAEEAKRLQTENITQIRQLTDEIRALNKTIAATRPIERQTTGTQQQTVDTQENTRIIGDFEKDFRVLDEFSRSKNPSAELISKVGKAIKDMIGILQSHAALIQGIPDYGPAIEDLQKATKALEARNQNQRNNTSG